MRRIRYLLFPSFALVACIAGPAGPKGVQGNTGQTGANGSLGIYGDGSADAGTISGHVTWTAPGNLQFTDFTVNASSILTVSSGTIIRCTGAFTNNGTIAVLPGALPGQSNGIEDTTTSIYSEQAPNPGVANSAAANGDFSSVNTGYVIGGPGGVGLTAAEAEQLLRPGAFGGGGGGVTVMEGWINNAALEPPFGEGGGSLVVLAQGDLLNSGTLSADGMGGSDNVNGDQNFGNGGGAGGVVILASRSSVTNTGTLTAVGGSGSDYLAAASSLGNEDVGAGAGGGGGIVHLLAPSVDAGTVLVTGGLPGATTANAPTGTSEGGGGGGGASGGSGGTGGGVIGTNGFSPIYGPATGGGVGLILIDPVDPTDLF